MKALLPGNSNPQAALPEEVTHHRAVVPFGGRLVHFGKRILQRGAVLLQAALIREIKNFHPGGRDLPLVLCQLSAGKLLLVGDNAPAWWGR